jgi:hypothetical protein
MTVRVNWLRVSKKTVVYLQHVKQQNKRNYDNY